jgi:hypothetical protein
VSPRKKTRPITLQIERITSPSVVSTKLIDPPIARAPKPTVLQVMPPSIPRFPIGVESAKNAKAEGKPTPTDPPKSTESMKFTIRLLVGIVTKLNDILEPKIIQKTSPSFLARGKSHPPKNAEIAKAAKKAPNNKVFVKSGRASFPIKSPNKV